MLFTGLSGYSQPDTTRYGGIRFSVDLARGLGWLTKPKQPAYELIVDAEVKDGLFVVAEGGQASLTFEKYNYNLASQGVYGRIGFDKNFLKRAYNENEMIYGGFRISGGRFTQQANNILIPGNYWDDMITATEPEDIYAFWFEFTAGIRAELFRNFFIGWGFRTRMFLQTSDHQLNPYFIPGYGNTLKSVSMGFQYIIAYRIPYKLKQ